MAWTRHAWRASDRASAGVSQFVASRVRVPAWVIYSTVVPAGAARLGLIARTAPVGLIGGGMSLMRFMKPAMAIAAICATMLTMMVMRSKKNAAMRKRRGLRRAR